MKFSLAEARAEEEAMSALASVGDSLGEAVSPLEGDMVCWVVVWARIGIFDAMTKLKLGK